MNDQDKKNNEPNALEEAIPLQEKGNEVRKISPRILPPSLKKKVEFFLKLLIRHHDRRKLRLLQKLTIPRRLRQLKELPVFVLKLPIKEGLWTILSIYKRNEHILSK
jgi:hypothetical protein